MKVTKVLYQKVFPLGQYTNEKIGVEMELSPSDDEGVAFAAAKMLVEKWHKEGNPLLYLITSPPPAAELPVIYKNEIISGDVIPGLNINDILSCNSLVVLDAYKGLLKEDDSLRDAYEKRRAQLIGDGGPR